MKKCMEQNVYTTEYLAMKFSGIYTIIFVTGATELHALQGFMFLYC